MRAKYAVFCTNVYKIRHNAVSLNTFIAIKELDDLFFRDNHEVADTLYRREWNK
jgi:hypothetical protein